MNSTSYSMTGYLLVMTEDQANREGVTRYANAFCDRLNEYSLHAKNNMNHFIYRGIVHYAEYEDRHALDYYVITRDVISFATTYYREELANGKFYSNPVFGHALFEREANRTDLQATMNRMF
ncbi:MAG: hypothetical protein ACREOZ_00055 [Gloeomargaritales cyanobacterium]